MRGGRRPRAALVLAVSLSLMMAGCIQDAGSADPANRTAVSDDGPPVTVNASLTSCDASSGQIAIRIAADQNATVSLVSVTLTADDRFTYLNQATDAAVGPSSPAKVTFDANLSADTSYTGEISVRLSDASTHDVSGRCDT